MKTNSTHNFDLTIIVPIYNEEDNIAALEERLSALLPTLRLSTCVLMVDDGSCDGSLPLIQAVCSRHADFFYASFERNAGLSAAIKAGFDLAESRYVGYMDADMQTFPEDFALLLEHVDDYELVMGIRAKRNDTWSKRIQSRIANAWRRMMTGDGVRDTGCPLKVLRTDFAKRIPMFTGMHRFLPALIMLQHGRVKQIAVRHTERVAGVSKFSLRNRLVGPFVDCIAFRWMRSRYFNYSVGQSNL